MKRKQIIIAIMMILALTISACSKNKDKTNDTTPTPTQTVTQPTPTQAPTDIVEDKNDTTDVNLEHQCIGVYKSAISGGQYHAYMHFYPTGTYYFYAMTTKEAGFYEIVDEPITVKTMISANDGGDDAEYEAACPQTLILTDFTGKETARLGFDGEKVYGALVFGGARDLFHDEAGAPGDGVYEAEASMCMYYYYIEGDEGSNVQIMHDGSYVDVMSYFIDGLWTLDGNTYTLVSPDEGTFTLEMSSDRKTAVYKTPDNTATDVILLEDIVKEVYKVFSGNYVSDDAQLTVTIYLYTDNTTLISQDFGGYAADSNGTWKEGADGSIEISDDSYELTAVKADGKDTYSVLFPSYYGDLELTEEGDVYALFTFEGGMTTIDINSDGTYKFTFAAYAMEESGTWKYENYALTLIQENGNEITSTIDSATYDMHLEYVAAASDQLKDNYVATTDKWGILNTHVVESSVSVLFTFEGSMTTIDINSDGTYTFTFAAYDMEEKGTWTYGSYTLTLIQENGNEITSSIDGATYNMLLDYVAAASDQLKDSYVATTDQWGVLNEQ